MAHICVTRPKRVNILTYVSLYLDNYLCVLSCVMFVKQTKIASQFCTSDLDVALKMYLVREHKHLCDVDNNKVYPRTRVNAINAWRNVAMYFSTSSFKTWTEAMINK